MNYLNRFVAGFLLTALCTGCTPSPERIFPSYEASIEALRVRDPDRNLERLFNLTSDYYASIDPTTSGSELKKQLHELIDDHVELKYPQLWEAMAYTDQFDQDKEERDRVLLLYTGWTLHHTDHGRYGDQWNREHVWSKNRGDFEYKRPAYTDLHHIRAADVSVNSKRHTRNFMEGGELVYDEKDPPSEPIDNYMRSDTWSWEPRDEVKGAVARMMFYMAVRYEGGRRAGEPDLELVDDPQPRYGKAPRFGVLPELLEWHRSYPPKKWEIRRNWRVYEYQGNRNPFIDHPEWVELIWGMD